MGVSNLRNFAGGCTLGCVTFILSPCCWIFKSKKLKTDLSYVGCLKIKGIKNGRCCFKGCEVAPGAQPTTVAGGSHHIFAVLLVVYFVFSTSQFINCKKELNYTSQCLLNLSDKLTFLLT